MIKKCRICFQSNNLSSSSITSTTATLMTMGKQKKPSNLETFLSFFVFSNDSDVVVDEWVRPCRCKGTMAWVHRTCLLEWRLNSSRLDSFYSCEQCSTKYKFKRSLFGSLVRSRLIVFCMTAFTSICFVSMIYLIVSSSSQFFEDLFQQPYVQKPKGTRVEHIDGFYYLEPAIENIPLRDSPSPKPPSRNNKATNNQKTKKLPRYLQSDERRIITLSVFSLFGLIYDSGQLSICFAMILLLALAAYFSGAFHYFSALLMVTPIIFGCILGFYCIYGVIDELINRMTKWTCSDLLDYPDPCETQADGESKTDTIAIKLST